MSEKMEEQKWRAVGNSLFRGSRRFTREAACDYLNRLEADCDEWKARALAADQWPPVTTLKILEADRAELMEVASLVLRAATQPMGSPDQAIVPADLMMDLAEILARLGSGDEVKA